jgi:hypothetical protein
MIYEICLSRIFVGDGQSLTTDAGKANGAFAHPSLPLGYNGGMENNGKLACDACKQFQRTIPITGSKVWEPVILAILEGIERGMLRITDGRLTYDDIIDCDLQCTHCDRRFKVSIETYHGMGGTVGPIP